MIDGFKRATAGRVTAASTVIAAGLLICATATAAAGGEITVTTTTDELNVDGDCSLREALVAANTNSGVDDCAAGADGQDTIVLRPVTYRLTIPGRGEDASETGDLDVTESAQLIGGSSAGARARVDAAGLDRVLDVRPGVAVGLFSLELVGGDAGPDEGGGLRLGDACGEASDSTPANMSDMVVRGNEASVGGGVHIDDCRTVDILWSSIIENHARETGGGVSAVGRSRVLVERSTFSGNSAGDAGGAWWANSDGGDLAMLFSTVAGNRAPDGAGLWVTGTTFPANPMATIMAANEGPNCGGVHPFGINLLSDDLSCGPQSGLAPGVEVQLDALTMVDGHWVHPPLAGSPAIDLVSGSECDQARSDQTGAVRPQDGDGDGFARCDVGAYEVRAAAAPAPSGVPNSATTRATGGTLVVTVGGVALLVVSALMVSLIPGPLRPPLLVPRPGRGRTRNPPG